MFKIFGSENSERYFRLKINYEDCKEEYLSGVADFAYGYDYRVRHVIFRKFVGYVIEFDCSNKDLTFSLMSDYMHDLVYAFGIISDNGYWSFSTEKYCFYRNVAICAIDSNCILNVEKGRGTLIWHCARLLNSSSFDYIDRHLVGFVNDLGLCRKLIPLMVG